MRALIKIRRLLTSFTKNRGRNNHGRITVRHRWNGHKRLFRIIDFRRNVINEIGILIRTEYDPNRTAFIGSMFYPKQSMFPYVLLPEEIRRSQNKIGTLLMFPKNKGSYKRYYGYSFPLGTIPLSIPIYNVETRPGSGGCIARAAGTCVKSIRRFSKLHRSFAFIGIQLPSGKTIYSFRDRFASLGHVSNNKHHLKDIGLAGRNFYYGNRPIVRGVAMNPIDHPHGGGEGKTSGGRPSVSRWGVLTKGVATRKPGKIKQQKKFHMKLIKKGRKRTRRG